MSNTCHKHLVIIIIIIINWLLPNMLIGGINIFYSITNYMLSEISWQSYIQHLLFLAYQFKRTCSRIRIIFYSFVAILTFNFLVANLFLELLVHNSYLFLNSLWLLDIDDPMSLTFPCYYWYIGFHFRRCSINLIV